MPVRGLLAALNGSGRYRYKSPDSVVDHLVVGGGVVGLAITRQLAQRFPDKSTYLVERHPRAGEETSSRNSEVIHSGLYYPQESLKTRLCLRGRHLLYEYCDKTGVPYRKTGKLVVATDKQRPYIENLHRKATRLEWPPYSEADNPNKPVLPTELISGDNAREMEPDLSKDIVAALWSPETGILDSHTLMESLEKDIIESDNGELVYSTSVVRVDPYNGSESTRPNDFGASEDGWVVQTATGSNPDDSDALLARILVNASGLSAPFMLNALLPRASRIPMYYARGSYASYHGPGVANISRLIYPCPEIGSNAHAFESLGTHLTLDMQGKVRFGPDIQWISPPLDADQHGEEAVDFWRSHLIPDESRLQEIQDAVTKYLPEVTLEGLQPDYVGIRPKLLPPGGGFQDFVVRKDYPGAFIKGGRADSGGPMISLMGIESPGLTSALAIAEMVVDDLLRGMAKGATS